MKTLALWFCLLPAFSAVTVSTAQYDNTRDGVNASETILTPSNVSRVANLGEYALDGAIYGQPLYVPQVAINGGTYDLLIVATMNNTLYALDADNVGVSPLWEINFGSNWATSASNLFYTANQIGILSTPVIDVTGGYIYLVSVSSTPTYTLRKVSLTTGIQAAHTDISASVTGSGGGSSGGSLPFTASYHTQRTPLTLSGGNVYFGFGSVNENTVLNWHGWVFSYDTATLTQQAVLCLSPNGTGAGVWEGGGGFAVDASGNLYFATGNGTYDGAASSDYAQSIVKVNASLVVQDWFTPSNNSSTSAADEDVNSGRVMLVPGGGYITVGGKDARVWLINTSSMGHLQGSGTAPRVFTVASITPSYNTGIFGGLFFNSTGFFPIAAAPTYAFSFSNGTFNTTAIANTTASYAQVMMSGSSNAGSNPIVWALTVSTGAYSSAQPVTLHAWNPATMAEYANWTGFGNYAKFSSPTVANGRVYVATYDGNLIAFGIAASPVCM